MNGGAFEGGVRLADDYPSLFSLTASGNTLISGGEYMIEASLVVTVFNILLGIFFLNRNTKKLAEKV